MSSSIAQAIPLNDCGCCEGISAETPVGAENRPGLSAIAYRVGTHAQFKETLVARLSGSRDPALAGLSTREDDDFSMALLDAWATVGDVLTFYQERIANESYLRTATERFSVLELARLINYELRPGVAAATYLAFTIEDAPGAAGQALAVGTTAQVAPEQLPSITIAAGTKVQSIPGPGEKAQTFETVEEIKARPEWNAIKPRLTQPQRNTAFIERAAIVNGIAADLKKGDLLLVVTGADRKPRKVLNVTIDDDAKTTRVDFQPSPADLPPYLPPSGLLKGEVAEFSSQTELRAEVTLQILARNWDEPDLSAVVTTQNWNANSLIANLAREIAVQNLKLPFEAYIYRQQAALFGYNAPKQPTYDKAPPAPDPPSEWDEWNLTGESETSIYLDRAYDGITPGSYITIEKAGRTKTVQVLNSTVITRTAYGLSSKSTLLTLSESWWDLLPTTRGSVFFPTGTVKVPGASSGTIKVIGGSGAASKLVGGTNRKVGPSFSSVRKLADFRNVIVYAQSEKLKLAELPVVDPVTPVAATEGGITFAGPYLGLFAGQGVILTGERDDLKGAYASESLILKAVTVEAGFTVITFKNSLRFSYVRKTVTINANVASATHGETVQETLGGGDATQPFQRFTLRQPPVTYVSSSDPSGAQSTLEVRVNDVRWREVPDFFGRGPEERIYTIQLDEAGNTTVIFGDGATGARLPTGQENIKAKYRKGIGLGGLLKANQLTQLMTRPLGVKGVTNPLAANGGADPEQLEEARRNATLTVLTLGRIVSLRDYEDFARTFSGIDKAMATWTWFGQKRGVFVTIAGAKGAAVTSPLYDYLLTAMQNAGDVLVPVQVKSYRPGLFRLAASLKVDADFLSEKVLAEAEGKLREEFSFEARSFGQPVHSSEVIAVLQTVPGVVAVNLTGLYRSDDSFSLKDHMAAAAPMPGETQVFAAELLTLDLQPLELGTFQ